MNRYEVHYTPDGLYGTRRLGLYRVRVRSSGQVLATFEYYDRAESERVRWEGDYLADVRRFGGQDAAVITAEREGFRVMQNWKRDPE